MNGNKCKIDLWQSMNEATEASLATCAEGERKVEDKELTEEELLPMVFDGNDPILVVEVEEVKTGGMREEKEVKKEKRRPHIKPLNSNSKEEGVGAKPAFFALQMRENEKKTFSLCKIRKWRAHCVLWAHRIKRKAALSWQSLRQHETLGLVGAAEHNESKPKVDQGSLPAKPIGEGTKVF
ncbi:ribosomal protein L2 [Canna indica]|uniref:Ribosomal protein L2 (Mitochondrion) n=1 Tax=Canna indica TaxID=4628 RepID=A0AAQ3KMA0_9LILI|nr:ribosomal protein L2 [Canna indica]